MTTPGQRTACALATAAALLLPAPALAVPAAVASTSYHVDNRPGSGCTDAGAGTQQQPWCTFAYIRID
ncbi:hypothetical protein ACH4L7_33145 [Streptomyces anulatus]